ncbi:DUF2232 domain-containing protein, partial [Bacillus sp. D-CC]
MRNTKFITECAALLAIYAMLLLISMYVPILGTVVTFALPLPFILLTIRYKISNAFVIFTAALDILYLIVSNINGKGNAAHSVI